MLVWCIFHEEMVNLEEKSCTGHTFVVYEDQEDFHYMTPDDFAYCPPPTALFSEYLDLGDSAMWAMWCEESEPSSNELFVMNRHARETELTWLERD